MSLALASATQATYSSGVKRFLNFCMLVYFAVALSQSLTLPTIRVYLSAVGSFHRRQGFKDPIRHNPQLKMVLCVTQRANIDRRSHPRQPITRTILHRVLHQVQHSYKLRRQDKHMLTAAFLLAFFGILRVSDFTIPSRSRSNPRTHSAKDSVACKRKYLPSQSKHQKQTSYTRIIRFTYSAPISNFAQSQPCKSTFIIFLATLQSERSRCLH